MKRKYILMLAAAVIALLVLAAFRLTGGMNPQAACRRDAEKHGEKLAALAETWRGEFVNRDHAAYRDFASQLQLELIAVNAREQDCTVFSFSSWHPETSVHLCYVPADQEDDGGFVPKDWVLMRENPEGELEVVREGVADYDFDGDALIWSDGRRILRSENGKTTVLHRGVFIPRIVVCK
jgi:hypothetical protein